MQDICAVPAGFAVNPAPDVGVAATHELSGFAKGPDGRWSCPMDGCERSYLNKGAAMNHVWKGATHVDDRESLVVARKKVDNRVLAGRRAWLREPWLVVGCEKGGDTRKNLRRWLDKPDKRTSSKQRVAAVRGGRGKRDWGLEVCLREASETKLAEWADLAPSDEVVTHLRIPAFLDGGDYLVAYASLSLLSIEAEYYQENQVLQNLRNEVCKASHIVVSKCFSIHSSTDAADWLDNSHYCYADPNKQSGAYLSNATVSVVETTLHEPVSGVLRNAEDLGLDPPTVNLTLAGGLAMANTAIAHVLDNLKNGKMSAFCKSKTANARFKKAVDMLDKVPANILQAFHTRFMEKLEQESIPPTEEIPADLPTDLQESNYDMEDLQDLDIFDSLMAAEGADEGQD